MAFHCLIVGSRGYTDYASFKAKCDALLAEKSDIEIVSGGASGTDALAERYALLHFHLCRPRRNRLLGRLEQGNRPELRPIERVR